MTILRAQDYFDLDQHRKRVEHATEAWTQLLTGERDCLVFMNCCAPFLCDLFGVELRDYYTKLEVMAETQLRGIAWRLENLDEDEIPRAVFLDQGTIHEALAFNLPVEYGHGSTPWGGHLLDDIGQIETLQMPSAVQHANLIATRLKLEHLRSLVQGLPVLTSIHLHAPLTMAAQILGVQKLLVACYEEPERVHKLLRYCVEYFLHFERVKWHFGISAEPLDEFVCWREVQQGMTRVWMSDDTASLLSPPLYERFALPYDRVLTGQFEYFHLHMDGRWDHLVPLVRHLSPDFCEVGGETDWPTVVDALGATTVLQGGILAETARDGTVQQCADAATRALDIADGKARVALTIANEVHPGTPVENMQAIIQAVRKRGMARGND